MHAGSLFRLLVLLAACATSGCVATSILLDTTAGRERYSKGERFAVDVSEAFLLTDGRVVLYGTERWSPLAEARFVTVPGPYENAEWPRTRVTIPASAWLYAHEPWERIVLAAPDRPDDAEPTPEDLAACTFRGALRQSATPIRILPPGSTLSENESAVLLLRDGSASPGTIAIREKRRPSCSGSIPATRIAPASNASRSSFSRSRPHLQPRGISRCSR
jgi:hypothetical protein